MNYSELSDFDINKLVAVALGVYHDDTDGVVWILIPSTMEEGTFAMAIANYCESPNDAWPIILESKINIIAINGDEWVANNIIDTTSTEGIINNAWPQAEHANPLRAAMEVFLMMNEDKS